MAHRTEEEIRALLGPQHRPQRKKPPGRPSVSPYRSATASGWAQVKIAPAKRQEIISLLVSAGAPTVERATRAIGEIERALDAYMAAQEAQADLAEWRRYLDGLTNAANEFIGALQDGPLRRGSEDISASRTFWKYLHDIYCEAAPLNAPLRGKSQLWTDEVGPSDMAERLAEFTATLNVARSRISTKGRDRVEANHQVAAALLDIWKRHSQSEAGRTRDHIDGSRKGPFAEFVRLAWQGFPHSSSVTVNADTITGLCFKSKKRPATKVRSRAGKK